MGWTDELRTGQDVCLWSWWCERALAVMFGELGSCLVGWPGKKYTNAHINAELGEQDVAWTVACNSDCVYVFCVTYITIFFTTHC